MDPETAAFQPRDAFWLRQTPMFHMQQGQSDLDDQMSQLERQKDVDARVKNVWEPASSPFASVPLQQPTAEHFSNFDDDGSNLIGNLQLDVDDEPRRLGATSRANSVRFDETANHGHWAHASRSSMDFIPRTGSGLGGHALSERSYSHKSEGGKSSAAQSVTSGRANSLTGYGLSMPPEPPGIAPGLFVLGPVPAIIRCWLNTEFKHDTLMYAAICSGSYASYLDARLIDRLGFTDRINTDANGVRKLSLPVFFPEAVPMFPSSRSSTPDPQIPFMTVDFTVLKREHSDKDEKTLQIIIGSDVLRTHSADILFSTNQLTLYDDSCSKLQIPFVRPEDERTFNSLATSNVHSSSLRRSDSKIRNSSPLQRGNSNGTQPVTPDIEPRSASKENILPSRPRSSGKSDPDTSSDDQAPRPPSLRLSTNRSDSKDTPANSNPPWSAGPRSATTSSAPWSKELWRRDPDKTSTSTDQRRSTGIKVLKPMRPTARTVSSGSGQSRFFDEGKRRGSNPGISDGGESSAEKKKEDASWASKVFSTSSKRASTGANAFPWLGEGVSK